jgi:hypothetical protein
MRKISKTFLVCLRSGFLSEITRYVRQDHDLNLEIREGYINVYYKGNSLLKLSEAGSLLHYKAEIHKKFLTGLELSLDFTEESVPAFIRSIPLIKENIVEHGRHSLELEYEQMIIRANNYEPRNNTEYFIIDRQYVDGPGRFDLTGIFWDRDTRQRNREASLCLMELKFAQNADIKQVDQQLARYYEALKDKSAGVAEEMQTVFRQKLELGLYDQSTERLNAMKSLTFSKEIESFQFILIFVDYNQNSTLLELEKIRRLPFAKQVRAFYTGFGMWQVNVRGV